MDVDGLALFCTVLKVIFMVDEGAVVDGGMEGWRGGRRKGKGRSGAAVDGERVVTPDPTLNTSVSVPLIRDGINSIKQTCLPATWPNFSAIHSHSYSHVHASMP